MSRDFYDPTPEQQNVILINPATLREAERLIESREHCNPDGAEIPFDNILDRVTGADPSVTDYILESPAKCSQCRREVLEQNADRAAITAFRYARIVDQPMKKVSAWFPIVIIVMAVHSACYGTMMRSRFRSKMFCSTFSPETKVS